MNIKTLSFVWLVLLISSCDLFEVDNYNPPSQTLQGIVVDSATGDPVLTDQYSEDGIRVRLTQLWGGDNVTHNPDFYCRPDGTFQNTKLFKGKYNIQIVGPFVPLVRENTDGIPLANGSKNVEISGVTKVTFKVQPFLIVKWAGKPTVSDGKVTARVIVTRGISEDDFRKEIEPMGNYSDAFLNITDIQLFVSYSNSVGFRAHNEQWSNEIDYSGSSFDPLLGQVVTITSKGKIPAGRTVFVRAAARINYDTPVGSGNRRWNYNKAEVVMIPATK